jgi:hypothetical protein
LQLYNRRRGITHKPAIEVLGTRRLGHRQELMIVRALGSDHLLLCTAGRAERVASTPTPPLPPEETLHLPPTPPTSQAGGIGLISRLSSQHRLRKLLDNVEAEAEAEADAAPEQPAYGRGFGAELYSATRKQGSGLYSVPVRPQSDAVAGISRLRKRTAT